MKTIYKVLFLLVFGLTSCTDIVTQKIVGPSDCISNGWSWNNGKATAGTDTDRDYDYIFSFKTTIAGDFSFSGKIYDSWYSYHYLAVFVNGQSAFYSDEKTTRFTKVSLGHVDAGVSITFKGWNYEVKDIIIRGQATKDEPTTEPNVNPEKPNDF